MVPEQPFFSTTGEEQGKGRVRNAEHDFKVTWKMNRLSFDKVDPVDMSNSIPVLV